MWSITLVSAYRLLFLGFVNCLLEGTVHDVQAIWGFTVPLHKLAQSNIYYYYYYLASYLNYCALVCVVHIR